MYLPDALHHGNPEFLVGVVVLLVGLVQSQSAAIGRAELEPLLWSRPASRRRLRRR